MAREAEARLQGAVLVACEDAQFLIAASGALRQEGHRVLEANNGQAALDALEAEPIDAVLADLRMPVVDGMEVLRVATAKVPPVPVVLLADFGTVERAVEAMKLGAVDYVVKPVDIKDLQTCVHQALERRRMLVGTGEAGRQEEITGFGGLLGTSRAMETVFDQIRLVAPFKSTVLITGESGTGKELVARAIHALSAYGRGPFIAINCGALPRDLVESELFGHAKGAFTGATSARQGLFEAADGGTLFLDEIGNLALEAQAKLLRVIEERHVTHLGSTQPTPVHVRLLAATNADLEVFVQERSFREDLYHRLNVLNIGLVPLRERSEDVPLLVRVFLDRFAEENDLPAKDVTLQTLALMEAYAWPGNVRELKNLVERLAITAPGQTIQVEDLPDRIRNAAGGMDATTSEESALSFIGMTLEGVERMVIRQTLVHTEGNRTAAAKMLGISLRTLQRKLKEYGGSLPDGTATN